MKVDSKSVDYDTCWRYLKTITDESSTNEHLKLKRCFEFLREIVNDGLFNGLLNCGPKGFDKFSMYHNGESWVIKLESEVPK
jgi:hypothetical protein